MISLVIVAVWFVGNHLIRKLHMRTARDYTPEEWETGDPVKVMFTAHDRTARRKFLLGVFCVAGLIISNLATIKSCANRPLPPDSDMNNWDDYSPRG